MWSTDVLPETPELVFWGVSDVSIIKLTWCNLYDVHVGYIGWSVADADVSTQEVTAAGTSDSAHRCTACP